MKIIVYTLLSLFMIISTAHANIQEDYVKSKQILEKKALSGGLTRDEEVFINNTYNSLPIENKYGIRNELQRAIVTYKYINEFELNKSEYDKFVDDKYKENNIDKHKQTLNKFKDEGGRALVPSSWSNEINNKVEEISILYLKIIMNMSKAVNEIETKKRKEKNAIKCNRVIGQSGITKEEESLFLFLKGKMPTLKEFICNLSDSNMLENINRKGHSEIELRIFMLTESIVVNFTKSKQQFNKEYVARWAKQYNMNINDILMLNKLSTNSSDQVYDNIDKSSDAMTMLHLTSNAFKSLPGNQR